MSRKVCLTLFLSSAEGWEGGSRQSKRPGRAQLPTSGCGALGPLSPIFGGLDKEPKGERGAGAWSRKQACPAVPPAGPPSSPPPLPLKVRCGRGVPHPLQSPLPGAHAKMPPCTRPDGPYPHGGFMEGAAVIHTRKSRPGPGNPGGVWERGRAPATCGPPWGEGRSGGGEPGTPHTPRARRPQPGET